MQQSQCTNKWRESITDFLNKRKDLRLAAKTHLEKEKLNYTEQDIQLKRKLIERMDKSDQEFQENLERINRTMENIGHSVQQSVGKVLDYWLTFYGQEPNQIFIVTA